MKNWIIRNNNVKVGVAEECGFLYPVVFNINGLEISPLSIAPWQNEKFDESIPPMLKNLRNDFFCAPFGDSDYLENETRAHGSTANDIWNEINITDDKIELALSKEIMGARVKKKISIIEDHSVVYEEHIFEGGRGKIPVGHHLMLKADEKLLLNFSNCIYGATPPFSIETNPQMGRSLLLYPQEFKNLKEVKLADGGFANLTKYPALKDHEDLLMLISDNTLPFAWSTAVASKSKWIFFALKSPRILRNTVLWFSNGGRYYTPFSRRHKNIIGIEETTSYFHLGHKASVNKNHLTEKGFKTFIELNENIFRIRYLFGLAGVPENYSRVSSIEQFGDGINIIDENGKKIFTKVNLNFIFENKAEE